MILVSQDKPYDVFLSYSHEDADWVEEVRSRNKASSKIRSLQDFMKETKAETDIGLFLGAGAWSGEAHGRRGDDAVQVLPSHSRLERWRDDS